MPPKEARLSQLYIMREGLIPYPPLHLQTALQDAPSEASVIQTLWLSIGLFQLPQGGDAMSGKIEPRYGVEVYVSNAGWICVNQHQPGDGELSLMFHRGEIPDLIDLLRKSYDESAQFANGPISIENQEP